MYMERFDIGREYINPMYRQYLIDLMRERNITAYQIAKVLQINRINLYLFINKPEHYNRLMRYTHILRLSILYDYPFNIASYIHLLPSKQELIEKIKQTSNDKSLNKHLQKVL